MIERLISSMNDFDQVSASPRDFLSRTDPRETYSFLKDIIDPIASMDVLKHILRGEEYDLETQKWLKTKKSMAMLNEIGIQKVMAELSRVSKDTNLSNLDKEEINLIMRHFGIVLNDLLYNNSDKIGLKDEDFQSIFLMIFHHVQFTLKRALGEGERKLLKPAINVTENISSSPQQDNGGMLGFIGRRR